jgi:pSer/pThr/pTyr-binding forkhead associated (FHA) protein
MARLILNCEGVGLIMRELGGDCVTIGRAPSNHIVVNHPSVSAEHAVLVRTDGSYSLKDLNSANGTQINGDGVTDAELKDGDTIRFGSVTAIFAGVCRERKSNHRIRQFWKNISSPEGAQQIAVATALGLSNLQPPIG